MLDQISGPVLIAAILLAAAAAFGIGFWLSRKTRTAEPKTISLARAVEKAWRMDEIRQLPEFQRLRTTASPKRLRRRIAERIFDGGDPGLTIRGTPYKGVEEDIPSPAKMIIWNDLDGMTARFADEAGEVRVYRNLRVRWEDVERSILLRSRRSIHVDGPHQHPPKSERR